MSHHLRSKRARTIAIREPNAAGTRRREAGCHKRSSRRGGAHVLKPFSHVVGCYHSRPSRSSSAGLVAPDRTFRAAETPGGSHRGSQPNAAPAISRHGHINFH